MTFKPLHILVPTDFSSNTRKALPYALNIAQKTGAKITILHNIEELYDFAPMLEEIKEKTKARVETFMDELLEEIQNEGRYRTLNVSTVIRFGRTVYSILDLSDRQKADFIVMGTKGASNIKRMIFGSNTTEIILLSKTPVLAVPGNSTYSDMEQLTFTTNYRDGDLESLKYVTGLASLFKSTVNVLHVAQSNDLNTKIKFRGFRQLVNEEIPYRKITFDLVIQKNFFNGLSDYQTDHDTRMIILTKYRRPFFYSLFEKDHSRRMGLYTKLPLMIVPGSS